MKSPAGGQCSVVFGYLNNHQSPQRWVWASIDAHSYTDVSSFFFQTQKVVKKNMAILDYSIRSIFNKIVVGEDDTVIQTTSTGLSCRRAGPRDIGRKPLTINSAKVNFPPSEIILNGTNTSFTDIYVSWCLALRERITLFVITKRNPALITEGIKILIKISKHIKLLLSFVRGSCSFCIFYSIYKMSASLM